MKLWWSCKFVPCGFCSLIHPTRPAISFTTLQLFLFRPIWSIWSICTLCRYVVRTVCYNECTANSRSHTLNISSSPREILMLSLSIQGFVCPNSQRLCCVPPMSRILCSDLGASIGNSTLQAGLPLSHIKPARSIRLWVCEMFLRTSSKLVHLVPSGRFHSLWVGISNPLDILSFSTICSVDQRNQSPFGIETCTLNSGANLGWLSGTVTNRTTAISHCLDLF